MRLLLTLASILAFSSPVLAQGAAPNPYVAAPNEYVLTVFENGGNPANTIHQEVLNELSLCMEKALEINVSSEQWAVCHQNLRPNNVGA